MHSEDILQVQDLVKYYGQVKAVDGISFRVAKGQVYGFLGPNGSGKTTTISMILGLVHPTAGGINLFGKPVSPYLPESLRRVGALVGAPALVPYFSARQNLEGILRLYPDLNKPRVAEILDMVGLSRAADRKASTFSTGMKQRLGLGMALLHKPELLILDEPTNGMDPGGMHEVRNLLVYLAEQGVTVFLSSHLLHEVEQICDYVAVINAGRMVAEGRVRDLVGRKAMVKVRVDSTRRAAQLLSELPGGCSIRANGEYVTIQGVPSQTVVAHLAVNGMVPSEVSNGHPDLEAIFLELTARRALEA